MNITKLNIENVKRIKAVSITPNGPIVQITGRNMQGKSSVLDGISMALGGKDWQGDRPVRDGEEKGEITVWLESGLVVKRTITATGGGALTITNGEGMRYSTPQAILDKLTGDLSFDPLAFSRMPAKQQGETLRELVGLDFRELDANRATAYAHRTAVARGHKQLQAQIQGTPANTDVPIAEISISDLSQKLTLAELNNSSTRRVSMDISVSSDTENRLLERKDQKQKELAEIEQLWCAAHEKTRKLEERASEMSLVDTAAIRKAIADADDVNRKVRQNAAREELMVRYREAEAEVNDATATIDAIDARKQERLAAAKFPVDGLSFDADGVTYRGLPFANASSAEQLRVSVAMGLAMNPKLKVLLIRDGSLLDTDNLVEIAVMAEREGAQVWIERVDDTKSIGVIIEDGEVYSPKDEAAK